MKMNSEEIISKIARLKKSEERIFTNSRIIFSNHLDKEWNTLVTEKSLVIILIEGKIKRILFYTISFEDLKQQIQSIGRGTVVEVVSKNKNDMREKIEELGFEKYLTQFRVSSKDITGVFDSNSSVIEYYNDSIGVEAEETDVSKINKLLWDTFDTRGSHLKTDSDLLENVLNGEFFVYKNSKEEIEMLIQHSNTPKSFYFNQVINRGDKTRFHALTLNLLKKYYDLGGRYAYAWVNEGNIASFRFFEKYTLVEDGVYNSIYCYAE